MHASELVELAALLATNAGLFIETSACAEAGHEVQWFHKIARSDFETAEGWPEG